jgi:hypothetical protein
MKKIINDYGLTAKSIAVKCAMIMAIMAFAIFQGCTKDEEVVYPDQTSEIKSLPVESLSEAELALLQHMREEEKLARDVYITLNEKWNDKVFLKISASEQRHMDAILHLLTKYNLPDPVGDNGVGVFTDGDLQVLYNNLVETGLTGILEAYTVGATIEDLDIYDLQQAKLNSDNKDLLRVWGNIMKASENHMCSFYGHIVALDGTYTAQYITQEELEEILSSDKGKR